MTGTKQVHASLVNARDTLEHYSWGSVKCSLYPTRISRVVGPIVVRYDFWRPPFPHHNIASRIKVETQQRISLLCIRSGTKIKNMAAVRPTKHPVRKKRPHTAPLNEFDEFREPEFSGSTLISRRLRLSCYWVAADLSVRCPRPPIKHTRRQ